jgi:hypothetical protein
MERDWFLSSGLELRWSKVIEIAWKKMHYTNN